MNPSKPEGIVEDLEAEEVERLRAETEKYGKPLWTDEEVAWLVEQGGYSPTERDPGLALRAEKTGDEDGIEEEEIEGGDVAISQSPRAVTGVVNGGVDHWNDEADAP